MTKKEPTLQSFLDNGALLIQAYPTTVLSKITVLIVDSFDSEVQSP